MFVSGHSNRYPDLWEGNFHFIHFEHFVSFVVISPQWFQFYWVSVPWAQSPSPLSSLYLSLAPLSHSSLSTLSSSPAHLRSWMNGKVWSSLIRRFPESFLKSFSICCGGFNQRSPPWIKPTESWLSAKLLQNCCCCWEYNLCSHAKQHYEC